MSVHAGYGSKIYLPLGSICRKPVQKREKRGKFGLTAFFPQPGLGGKREKEECSMLLSLPIKAGSQNNPVIS